MKNNIVFCPTFIHDYISSGIFQRHIILIILSLICFWINPTFSLAIGNKSYISTKSGKGYFPLCVSGQSAALYISSEDYSGAIRALTDLQTDILHVTNTKPILSEGTIPKSKHIVLVGTIGKSPVIDKLIGEKALNVTGIKGKWESFVIQVVKNPFPGVKSALVIAGSDKRGTIFGIYDISEKIGISPWNWWADVPAKHHSKLFVLPGRHSFGPPAVKYRGIFINDEAPSLSGWAQEKFGGFNHKFYKKVFNLILRLKGNLLWPAMWGHSFFADDSLDEKLADEYGIVMGTSHAEPMMRAVSEWKEYGHGPWNYQANGKELRKFWSDGIKRMDNYESIVTVDMRGNGDMPMSDSTNIGLLEKIVHDQRNIIHNVTGKPVSSIPQVWTLYKEVEKYYLEGMRVPNDITLMFSDDNWGNIRMLPKLHGQPRPGGYGLYYHYDYVGGPRSYKWMNTVQIERTWEQLHLAYKYGVKRIWVVNVGSLKPKEFPIQFFMDYAWNPQKWPANRLPEYYKRWAQQQFGTKFANEIAQILMTYTRYNARRKPELLSPKTYSLDHYRESGKVVADYNCLKKKAMAIYNKLPDSYKPSFYQLVLYPVQACANLNDLYKTVEQNRLFAKEGRAITNNLAQKAHKLFKKDAELSHYYDKVMLNGKWDHIMHQPHIGYTSWAQPKTNIMPKVKHIELPEAADMGVAIQGSNQWWPKDTTHAILSEFDKYNQQRHYIEIFNRGKTPFNYSIKTDKAWIKISPGRDGQVNLQKRIWIQIDWKNAPGGELLEPLTITGPKNKQVVVYLKIDNPPFPKRDKINGFIESDGYISIDAQHYSKAVNSKEIHWVTIPNLGRTASAMTTFPVTANEQKPERNSPHLEYKVYLNSKGPVNVKVYLSPTLNFEHDKGLRYALSFDTDKPVIVNMNGPLKSHLWPKWVSNNVNIQETTLHINKPGEHILKFWRIDPAVDVQKIVIDAGGVKHSYLGPPESFHRQLK